MKQTVKNGNLSRFYPVQSNGKNREPFKGNRWDIFPVPVSFRPVPVPFLSTVDQNPSNAGPYVIALAETLQKLDPSGMN